MERYSIKQGDLFKKGDTNDLENLLKQEASKRIQSLEDDYVLNVSEIEYVNYLTEDLRIECPEIQFENCEMETRKAILPKEFLPDYLRRSLYHQEIVRTVYRLCIPISGDKDVLRFCPSTYTYGGAGRFSFNNNELYIDIPDTNGNGENLASDIKLYSQPLKTRA